MKRRNLPFFQSATWFLAVVTAATLFAGCKSRPRQAIYIVRHKQPDGPRPVAPPSGPHLGDSGYQRIARPILSKYGCDSGACHGDYRGGGLYLSAPDGRSLRDYKTVLARLDREHPEQSELVLKMLNKVPHNGGRNIDEDSCDMKKLLAWIGTKPEPVCSDPPPPDQSARFAREVAPAIVTLGCADKACHGGGPSTKKLDLSGLLTSPPHPELALRELNHFYKGLYSAWTTPIMHAADANDGIHKQPPADKQSCAYRRLYGYFAKAPELTCELAPATPALWPSLEVFTTQVLPALTRRGCLQTACHGSGAGGMTLVPSKLGDPMAVHDYTVLLARVEDLADLGKSTLLRTARNQEPHGGGQRLGGKGDCVDDQLSAWLKRQQVKDCAAPVLPSYERFVTEMQPTLDKMTCTNPKCHGKSIVTFTLKRNATAATDLLTNYRTVLKHIDFDYAPFSGIMLRMREVCAYAVTAAWIEKRPRPNCVVHDPDPRIFPRRDDEGQIVHSLVAPKPVPEDP